jgi:O-antigen/teichoic acid export membrane protein
LKNNYNISRSKDYLTGESLLARYAHGAFWSMVGMVGNRIFTFLAAIITARFLGKTGFGELAMIQSTMGLMGTFAGFGGNLTTIKYVAELKDKDPERAGRIISLTYLVSWVSGGIITLGCLVSVPWLAAKTINAPHLAPELRLACIWLFISIILGPQSGIMIGFQAYRSLAKINFWQGLLSLPITVLLVWRFGLRGAILALIAATVLNGIMTSLALSRQYQAHGIHLKFFQGWREKAVLWKFSLPAFLAGILYTPVNWAARAMLANQPGGYAELGLFSAAVQFQFMITAFSSLLTQVSSPLLADIYARDEKERFVGALNLNLRITWGLAIIGGFLSLVLSPWLIRLFGEKFYGARDILAITICFTVVTVASGVAWQAFFSTGRMWHNLGITFFWALTLIVTAKLLIPHFGALGLSFAFLAGYILAIGIQLLLIARIIDKEISINNTLNFILSVFLIVCALIKINDLVYPYLFNLGIVIISIFLIYLFIKESGTIFRNIMHDLLSLFLVKIRKICLIKHS